MKGDERDIARTLDLNRSPADLDIVSNLNISNRIAPSPRSPVGGIDNQSGSEQAEENDQGEGKPIHARSRYGLHIYLFSPEWEAIILDLKIRLLKL
jgi:hypothetical protein